MAAAPSMRRSWPICACRALAGFATSPSLQSASISRSALTGFPRRSASRASRARCFPPRTGTGTPSSSTSNSPKNFTSTMPNRTTAGRVTREPFSRGSDVPTSAPRQSHLRPRAQPPSYRLYRRKEAENDQDPVPHQAAKWTDHDIPKEDRRACWRALPRRHLHLRDRQLADPLVLLELDLAQGHPDRWRVPSRLRRRRGRCERSGDAPGLDATRPASLAGLLPSCGWRSA
jgi:hypothetical protein